MAEAVVKTPKLIGADLERCIFSNGKSIRREGKHRKKLELVQLWYCRECDRAFSPQTAKGKTYPLRVILEALQLYYRGETRAQTSKQIQERFGIRIPARTFNPCYAGCYSARRTTLSRECDGKWQKWTCGFRVLPVEHGRQITIDNT